MESADKVTMEDDAYAGLGPTMREQLLKVARKKAAEAAASDGVEGGGKRECGGAPLFFP